MYFDRSRQLRYALIALIAIATLLALHHYNRAYAAVHTEQRTQTVTISSAGFLPSRIAVRAGEPASLMIVNTDVKPHNLAIPALHIKSIELMPSQSTILQFTPSTKGQFTFVSDIPGYPETGYQGLLIIE
ncbi:cupredoxin domain-containing protein [Brevibacillus sp. TJ4]|uniref:cupredoxin domain-containing protein n=1 Tax=Brevibacillus sp. TJ4 TaxID=3234853 RepID=UPI0037D911A0